MNLRRSFQKPGRGTAGAAPGYNGLALSARSTHFREDALKTSRRLGQGLVCLGFGMALNAAAQMWPGATQPSQTPSTSTVLSPSTTGTNRVTAAQQRGPILVSPAQGTQQASGTNQPATVAANHPPAVQSDWESHEWKLEKINPEYDWTRHFRMGMLVGFNIKADFTMSGTFNTGNNTPGVYDNGYVLTDSRGATGDGVVGTGNFGYDNASQIGNGGTTLTMDQTTGFTVGNGNSSGNDSPYVGFDLAYGDSYWYWEHAKLGWEFGFGLLPIRVEGEASVTANQNAYAFDIAPGGINLSLLPQQPPFQGGYNQNGPGSGPALQTIPASTNSMSVAGKTGETLSVMLYTFRLGPTLYWNLTRRIGFYAGGGPAVGLVSGDLTPSGTVTLVNGTSAHYNASSVADTDFIYGGYVNATLVYHAVEGGDFYLGAQYMPMGGANFNGNGMSAHLDLNGQVYVTAGINWPF